MNERHTLKICECSKVEDGTYQADKVVIHLNCERKKWRCHIQCDRCRMSTRTVVGTDRDAVFARAMIDWNDGQVFKRVY